jgi:hypothetical protein
MLFQRILIIILITMLVTITITVPITIRIAINSGVGGGGTAFDGIGALTKLDYGKDVFEDDD